jgi:hypothetical protein
VAINFSIPDKEIQIDGILEDLQDLGNATRLFESSFPMMSEPKIIDWFGKQVLGGGKFVGITMVLLNGWKIKADDRGGPGVTLVTVTGGNLVGDIDDPVEAASFVSYVIEQSTSAALITANLDATNASIAALEEIFVNKKDIDFTGSDLLGWQEVAYEDDDTTVAARWNLFDETDTRIDETAASFVSRGGMIKTRTPV